MIKFEEFVLKNGLKVIVHEDPTTTMAAVNILYKVGSRDEDVKQTGFAHLFEHFMFEGSVNIPEFDTPLQNAGGENNAFTSNDITNYYDILPANNLETAFWLESDRMLSLAFEEESLTTQKNVVMEEFKEHYINQPYGDVWHKMCDLAYKVHPYKWPVIGLNLQHIEQVKMQSAKDFYFKYYRPNNAVMVVAGNVKAGAVQKLAEKWFGEIPAGEKIIRNLPQEPVQKEERILEIKADVPVHALYKAYKMGARLDANFYASDLLRDILSTGDSSRLYQQLVKERKLFSSISAYSTETVDAGLLMVEGRLAKDVSMDAADKAVTEVLEEIVNTKVSEEELTKVKNKIEAYVTFGEVNILNRAMNLAYFEMLGNAGAINSEVDRYMAITSESLQQAAASIFQKEKSSTIKYYSNH
ncbi:MAG TPA: pitrilysin family protein [Chitinophagales bacterium]|nr:pitrilysin family protein [Chitinophagales bacterium]